MGYVIFLSKRYLRSKIIPLLAVGAVALCVALIIVVISVMTGFLNMIRDSGSRLMGDAVIAYPTAGIPWFDELEKTLLLEPAIKNTTSVVEGLGLLKMPYPLGNSKQIETVQIWGIDPITFNKVTDYENCLYWKTIPDEQINWLIIDAIIKLNDEIQNLLTLDEKKILNSIISPFISPTGNFPSNLKEIVKEKLPTQVWQIITNFDKRILNNSQSLKEGLSLYRDGLPGIVPGIHVSDGNQRTKKGNYKIAGNGYWWMPRFDMTLTMVPIDREGGINDPESTKIAILNEFQSGLFAIDDNRVFIPIDLAQNLLHLNEAEIIDPINPLGEPLGIDPARATHVFVKAAKGYTANEAKLACEIGYKKFLQKILSKGTIINPPLLTNPGLTINTWEEQQSAFIGPVEKERELMRTLFGIVYLVCAALILSIFWAIVSEKTKDIGILRAIGSSRIQIIQIFLLYGTSVGIAGSLIGIIAGWVIIKNINLIHYTLGNPPLILAIIPILLFLILLFYMVVNFKTKKVLPLVIGTLVSLILLFAGTVLLYLHINNGVVIWDPSVYYFTKIPNKMDFTAAIIAALGAIFFSLLGALIPAAKAADTDPIKALRYE